VLDATPSPLYTTQTLVTHCRGSWVGHKAGLDGCGEEKILSPHWHSNPSSP